MPKFFVERDQEEEEGTSNMTNFKRQRSSTLTAFPHESEDSSLLVRKQVRLSVANDIKRSGYIVEDDALETVVEPEKEESGTLVTLTDPDVLDCSICMEYLTPPVFQCENGHIACSPCCIKLHNKCPSCSLPIGYNRCLAIEKVIESIKVFCGYKPYGCGEKVSFIQKHAHEKTCIHAPVTCPISDCNFRGSSKQVSLHISSKHPASAKRFRYNHILSVSFGKLDEYLVFQEEKDGLLFVLINQLELIGSAIKVVCLGPCPSNKGFSYALVAKKDGSSLRLHSHTLCVKERPTSASSVDFLLVPYDFYSVSGQLKLEVAIRGLD